MSFDWQEFLVFARRLSENPQITEAERRCAVSRAYCAAYHTSRIHSRVVTKGEDSHAKVWNALKNSANRIEKAIGVAGDRLKGKRVKADYDGFATVDRSLLADALADAKNIIDRIDQLRREQTLN